MYSITAPYVPQTRTAYTERKRDIHTVTKSYDQSGRVNDHRDQARMPARYAVYLYAPTALGGVKD